MFLNIIVCHPCITHYGRAGTRFYLSSGSRVFYRIGECMVSSKLVAYFMGYEVYIKYIAVGLVVF